MSLASSAPSRSAPIEQQPWPRLSAGSSRMPTQPRPQMHVQFEARNDLSKRHVVGPSTISSIAGSTRQGYDRSAVATGWGSVDTFSRHNGRVRHLEIAMLCPAGFEDVAVRAAGRELPKFEVAARSSGFIHGRCVASVKQVREFPCATNVFHAVMSVPRSSIERELEHVARELKSLPPPVGFPTRGTLRLRIHDDGRFASTASPAARALERSLASWSKLGVARQAASLEIWLLRRRENLNTLVGTKLSDATKRESEPGALRPEICAALARVVPLSADARVIDPFAGTGGVGFACAAAGAGHVWLNDLSNHRRRAPSEQSAPATKASITWTHDDFRSLDVQPGSITAVITDPPWGEYGGDHARAIDELYADLGRSAARWLQPGGALVVLTGATPHAVERMLAPGELEPEAAMPVLVNGHKAKVVLARKKHASKLDRA